VRIICRIGRWRFSAFLLHCQSYAYSILFTQQVLMISLGPSWSSHFKSFDRIPFAAASIGQVHTATLASTSNSSEKKVAVKVQFPNIVNSIESDLGYIKLLLSAGRLLPKGLFLDRTVQVGQRSFLIITCIHLRRLP
jgi:predicted unusual protein kinase regulating ubiquinone biosynthesis (AarF/ABC1/UbiB family)